MKFPALVLSSICCVVSISASAPVFAHIQLVTPLPRDPKNDGIKLGPCGSTVRSPAKVTTAKPGDTITVEWDETISHPGYFRILFDEDGQNDLIKPTMASFKLYSDYYYGQRNGVTVDKLPKLISTPTKEGGAWVLADNWGLHPSGAKRPWMLKVTLPNVTCNNCTLQVVQGMFENSRTYDSAYYYHCADFILKGDVAATDGGVPPGADAGVPPGSGGVGGAAQGSAGGAASNSGGQGGKSAGGSAGSSSGQGGSQSSGGSSPGDEGGNAGSSDNSEKSDGGCSLAGRKAGFAGSLLLAVAALFLARRRRS